MDFQNPGGMRFGTKPMPAVASYRELGSNGPLVKSVVAAAAAGYVASSFVTNKSAFLLALFVGSYVYSDQRSQQLPGGVAKIPRAYGWQAGPQPIPPRPARR